MAKCKRSWWRGGHCWHFTTAWVKKPVLCEGSGTPIGEKDYNKYWCCICEAEKLTEMDFGW